jgi:hypothetical protein
MIEEIEAQVSAGNWDGALAAVIALMKADSGTIHVIGSDGQLHLRAASAGIPPPVLTSFVWCPLVDGGPGGRTATAGDDL